MITAGHAHLADRRVVSHVRGVEEHGSGWPREVRGLCDGRGRDEGAMLEYTAVGLYGHRHMHCIGDSGALKLRQQRTLEEIALVRVCVRERDTETSSRSFRFCLA